MKRVEVIPLLGQPSGGAVCTLLQIDDYRVLLDCGHDASLTQDAVQRIAEQMGRVDLVLLSHGDAHHMGGVPLLLAGAPIPVLCTLPVFKFGRMMLYDLYCNTESEGNKTEMANMFSLDDVDESLAFTATVKYNQSISYPFHSQVDSNALTLCAFPSGRTIGGSIWRLQCGAMEVMYAVDVNLRKDSVIDAVSIRHLQSPYSLLITDGGCDARVIGEPARKRGARDKDSLVDTVMQTLRGEGSVLIPCETGARTLELLYLLDKHWSEGKVGLYPLVLCSPMASHIVDYARSQLEWMRDSLSRAFYNEKPNPFALSQVLVVTSAKELAELDAGPKVVLCTEFSLGVGVAKELLIRWAGDARNRVIFTDYPDRGSLAFTLLSQSQSPPVVASVTHPERVMISGEELTRHMDALNQQEREREERLQRTRFEEELMELASAKQSTGFNDEDEDSFAIAEGDGKRSLKQVESIAKFAKPWHPMFETRESTRTVDEYGMSIEDLDFSLINSTAPLKKGAHVSSGETKSEVRTEKENVMNKAKARSVFPTKIITKTSRMQFLCDFKVLASLNGRADSKAVKNLIGQALAKRVLLLRGGSADLKMVGELRDSSLKKDTTFYVPKTNTCVSFEDRGDKFRLLIPQSLLPPVVNIGKGVGSNTTCSVFILNGGVTQTSYSLADGVRLLRFVGAQSQPLPVASSMSMPEESADAVAEEGDVGPTEEERADIEINPTMEDEEVAVETSLLKEFESSENQSEVAKSSLVFNEIGLGIVSVGEIQLKTLKEALEASGISVEYRLANTGSVLVCGNQVIIRKDSENDFVLEGPPTDIFFQARRILYDQFALL